ncbi:MAG TPA: MBL fold metallo-hydrolase [Polyangia bacterium]|jgi:glyoxylase-like metal-dependent hydrolase (beta-lactamase superfamily II)|nr:MBL fold metallo-hydrolase [Polyangia bacterium]
MKKITMSTMAVLLASAPALAQMGDPAKVTLKTSPVAGGVSVIEGENGFAGGNVAVTVGDDGVFIIDDEIAPMTPKLKAALGALTKKPVRFVVNTHWHADHTGGNPAMAAAGAVIIAHDNVRKRLSVDQFMDFLGQKMTFPALPPAALPVVTFSDDVTLHLNGDEIHVFHVPPAHTDGDAIVHFKKANVIHMGDTFVTISYPLVDTNNGGVFAGFITAAEKVLAMCDDNTKIIPGHGQISSKADLKAWHDMLVQIHDRIGKQIAAKKSVDDIKASKPTAEWDAKFGQMMVKGDQLVEMIVKTWPAAPERAGAAKKAHKAN